MRSKEADRLIEDYILNGRTPALSSPHETETPVTYVQRIYSQQGSPPVLRKLLHIAILQELHAEKRNWAVLDRGVRLAALIAHEELRGAFEAVLKYLINDRSEEAQSVFRICCNGLRLIRKDDRQEKPI